MCSGYASIILYICSPLFSFFFFNFTFQYVSVIVSDLDYFKFMVPSCWVFCYSMSVVSGSFTKVW